MLDFVVAVKTNSEAAKIVQPAKRSFRDPSKNAKAISMFLIPSSQVCFDALRAKCFSVSFGVIDGKRPGNPSHLWRSAVRAAFSRRFWRSSRWRAGELASFIDAMHQHMVRIRGCPAVRQQRCHRFFQQLPSQSHSEFTKLSLGLNQAYSEREKVD